MIPMCQLVRARRATDQTCVLEIMNQRYRRGRCSAGHTLLEMVLAMAAATILLGGMASTIFLAGRSLDINDSTTIDTLEAGETLGDVTVDLQNASSFTERAATAVTLTTPDRDGDDLPETIRYAWSGTAADPLMIQCNGGAASTLISDVQDLNFTYATRLVVGTGFAKGIMDNANLLFVVTSATSPTIQETARQALFESWYFAVTRIDVNASQTEFDAAAAINDVAYISEDVLSSDLNTKLRDAALGVVNEEQALNDEFGTSSSGATRTKSHIDIVDDTHYITSGFSIGSHQIYSWNVEAIVITGTVARDLQVLGKYGNDNTLAVLESGDKLYDNDKAAGRRVQLPWGGNSFDVTALNEDGLLLMRRAVEWAAGFDSL
jgi:hypothetical protein